MSTIDVEMATFCCICLETDEDDTSYETLECCGNQMHSSCFTGWVLHRGFQATCPMCRMTVDISKIPRKMFFKNVVEQSLLTAQQRRNLHYIRSEYETETLHFVMLYVAIFLFIGVLLCLIVSFV
jgi:hypothetical protein